MSCILLRTAFEAGMHFFIFLFMTFTFQLNLYQVPGRRFYPQRASGQAVVTGVYLPFFPPGTCLYFLSRIGVCIPTACRFSSNVANSRSRAFRYLVIIFFKQEKASINRSTSMHSVRLEPTKLILTRTRTTYHATGDAGI